MPTHLVQTIVLRYMCDIKFDSRLFIKLQTVQPVFAMTHTKGKIDITLSKQILSMHIYDFSSHRDESCSDVGGGESCGLSGHCDTCDLRGRAIDDIIHFRCLTL